MGIKFLGEGWLEIKRERAEANIEEILYQKIKRNFHNTSGSFCNHQPSS